MRSFSEQLSEYVQRIGVSDAELARRLGVSRQTVFRWREGLTRRPRRREDVLEIASRLRLSSAERDSLLLAAGFPPQVGAAGESGSLPATRPEPPGVAGPSGAAASSPEGGRLSQPGPGSPASAIGRGGTRPLWLLAGTLAALALAATAIPALREKLTSLGTSSAPPSQPETLVLIAQFANYSGVQVGYNVAGRLQEALEQELQAAGLSDVQVTTTQASAVEEGAARELGVRQGASLVVWGEYDSGRVITRVSATEALPGVQRRWLVLSPEQLSATINADLPQDVRWMTLYLLGRVHLLNGRLDQAEAALTRSLAAPPADLATQAAAAYFLGLTESQRAQADLNEVIAYYSEALALQPALTAALNNRGVAYLERRSAGDLERAEADLRRALYYRPDDPVALFNLALALARQGEPELEEALELLEQAEAADPDSAGVQNALCWFLGLSGEPQRALPHCDAAVALDESGSSNDSRGLVLALLGQPEQAAVEFEILLERLPANDPAGYAQFAPTRREWIQALRRGENPFDPATLQRLLQE